MSSPLERGQRRARARQNHAEQVFAKQLTETLDVETLLLDKIEQKTRGGIAGLRKAFRNFNTSWDQDEISFPLFKENLVRFGLPGLPEEDSYALFVKYDDDGGGTIDFQEFIGHLMRSYRMRALITDGSSKDHGKNARDLQIERRKGAEKLTWETLNVNAENLLLHKLDERVASGPKSLRRTFRILRSSNSRDSGPGISMAEFNITLKRLGLQGLSTASVENLFKTLDKNGDGEIDFDDFQSYMMIKDPPKVLQTGAGTGVQAGIDKIWLSNHKEVRERLGDNDKRHWKYFVKHGDAEGFVLNKLRDLTGGGGMHALRKLFTRNMRMKWTRAVSGYEEDTARTAEVLKKEAERWSPLGQVDRYIGVDLKSNPSAKEKSAGVVVQDEGELLTVNAFKEGLSELGLRDIPDRVYQRVFRRLGGTGKPRTVPMKLLARRLVNMTTPLEHARPSKTRHHSGKDRDHKHSSRSRCHHRPHDITSRDSQESSRSSKVVRSARMYPPVMLPTVPQSIGNQSGRSDTRGAEGGGGGGGEILSVKQSTHRAKSQAGLDEVSCNVSAGEMRERSARRSEIGSGRRQGSFKVSRTSGSIDGNKQGEVRSHFGNGPKVVCHRQ